MSKLYSPVAILFDLDGTLVDSMHVFADVAADVMHRHHGADPTVARRRYLETSGIPFAQQLEVIYPGDERNAAAEREFEVEKLVATKGVLPTAETQEALRTLQRRGYKIAVCSNNSQENVEDLLGQCDVELELVLGFGNGLAKGEPHFSLACETFSCAREQLLFVGDSVKDGELAAEGGIDFIAVLGTFDDEAFREAAPNAHQIRQITELLELVA